MNILTPTLTHRLHLIRHLVLASILTGIPCHTASAQITRIVGFGDSYTDSGNFFAASGGMTHAPPYWEGRASNGPVWVEHLADYLGVPRPAATRQGGTNAAFGSAPTGQGTVLDSQIPPVEIPRLGAQIEEILASYTLGPNDLVVIWGGHVDLFNTPLGEYRGRLGPVTPAEVVDNLTDHVRALQNAGATNFLVSNFYPGEPFGSLNTLWSARADELRRTEPIRLHRLDFGRLWSQIETNPAQFGFTAPDWREPIIGRLVANPDEYAFWDDVHPTTPLHRVIAEAAFETLRHVDGDYNDNGLVEQGDLDFVLLNWGQRVSGTFLNAAGWVNDPPTRRQIDQDELDRVLFHWGQTPLVPDSPLAASAGVPEPASLLLLAVVLPSLIAMRLNLGGRAPVYNASEGEVQHP